MRVITEVGATRQRQPVHGEGEPGGIELESVVCPLCRADDAERVISAHDPATGLGGLFHVVRCRRCGMAYTNPRPSRAAIGQFYPVGYQPHEAHAWGDGWGAQLGRRLERAVLQDRFGYPGAGRFTPVGARIGRACFRRSRQRAFWVPFRPPGRLLDFGCGAALFLRKMRAYGWSVEGLDISASVVDKVQRETGIRVHVGSLPHPAIVPGSYDMITMWNALEHVHDPRAVLAAARDALRPGGTLVIGVPNFASAFFRAFGTAWFPLELPRHLSHFTPATITEMLRREGLELRELRLIGRDGWLRRSVEMARRSRCGPRWGRLSRWKPLRLAAAGWSERTGQADFLRVMAERPSGPVKE